MSVYQKALKAFSIVVIVMGAIVVATGAVVIVTAMMVGTSPESTADVSQLLAEQGLDANGSAVTYEVASMGVSVAFYGAIFIATGIFGLLAARDPNVTLPVIVLSLIGLSLAMLNIMGGLVSGTYTLPGSGPVSLATSVGNAAIMAFLLGLSMYCRAAAKEGLIEPIEKVQRKREEREERRLARQRQLRSR